MKYNPYIYATGALLGIVGFVANIHSLVLLATGICAGSTAVLLAVALRGFLPATLGGEKTTMEHSFVTVLVYLAQLIAMLGLWSKFSFWDFNPQAMRTAVYLYLPTLLILLFQMRLTAGEEAIRHYRSLLIMSLLTASITFLFFLTPEKKLAQRFYATQPEKLQPLLQEIEKRTPKPKPRKKPETEKK